MTFTLTLRALLASTLLAAAVLPVCADPGRLTVQVDQPGARLSPDFFGLMTEEINHSYDGGLYAELIQNRSFRDDPRAPAHWAPVQDGGAAAALSLDTSPSLEAALASDETGDYALLGDHTYDARDLRMAQARGYSPGQIAVMCPTRAARRVCPFQTILNRVASLARHSPRSPPTINLSLERRAGRRRRAGPDRAVSERLRLAWAECRLGASAAAPSCHRAPPLTRCLRLGHRRSRAGPAAPASANEWLLGHPRPAQYHLPCLVLCQGEADGFTRSALTVGYREAPSGAAVCATASDPRTHRRTGRQYTVALRTGAAVAPSTAGRFVLSATQPRHRLAGPGLAHAARPFTAGPTAAAPTSCRRWPTCGPPSCGCPAATTSKATPSPSDSSGKTPSDPMDQRGPDTRVRGATARPTAWACWRCWNGART